MYPTVHEEYKKEREAVLDLVTELNAFLNNHSRNELYLVEKIEKEHISDSDAWQYVRDLRRIKAQLKLAMDKI